MTDNNAVQIEGKFYVTRTQYLQQKNVPYFGRTIAGPVQLRIRFEIWSVRTGFEMDRVTHGQSFLRVQ